MGEMKYNSTIETPSKYPQISQKSFWGYFLTHIGIGRCGAGKSVCKIRRFTLGIKRSVARRVTDAWVNGHPLEPGTDLHESYSSLGYWTDVATAAATVASCTGLIAMDGIHKRREEPEIAICGRVHSSRSTEWNDPRSFLPRNPPRYRTDLAHMQCITCCRNLS